MSSTDVCDARRVSVQTPTGSLDLDLPANVVVAGLIPPLVDLASAAGSAHAVPMDWRLSHVDGRPLSQRHSLHGNGVRDGDMLVLSQTRVAGPPPRTDDAVAGIATALERYPRWSSTASTVAGSVAALLCSALAAYALLHGDRRPAAVVAGLLSLTALVAAVACGRLDRHTATTVTLGGCAVLCATVAGYLAVPGDVAAPRLLLAGAVCTTVSIVTARAVATGTAVFVAAATAGVVSALGAAVPAFVPVDASAAGALLAAAALGTLAFAARLALWAGRARVPQLPEGTSGVDADPHRTHAIATGFVCGSSAAAALGAVLTTHAGAAFATVVGVVLVMRAGTHVDLIQASALIISGAACLASAFLWAVGGHPHAAHWIALGAASVGAAGMAVTAAAPSVTVSPMARRCVELLEYGALAAVLPLACWVGGVFGAVRAL